MGGMLLYDLVAVGVAHPHIDVPSGNSIRRRSSSWWARGRMLIPDIVAVDAALVNRPE